ncbi:amino acid adenylation domain-containing protein [candidate division KSB1 bacterium]|nr:amino acid adenylation domain-containing protein [candidate division KSB1 bacterium]
MNLDSFLRELFGQGVELYLDGEKLCYRGPEQVLSSDVLNRINGYKSDIKQLLRERAEPTHPQLLSFGQKALWYVQASEPSCAAYNTAFSIRIRSRINMKILHSVLQKLVARHASLRTTFPLQNGLPVRIVRGYEAFSIEEIDAAKLSWEELRNRLVLSCKRPFHLETGPLLRVNLFSRSSGDHILLLVIHHICTDFWSGAILMREVAALYQAEVSGAVPSLPTLTHQYQDYIEWQNDMLAGTRGDQLWTYWQQQLSGDLPILSLPTDRARPRRQSYNGGYYYFTISPKLLREIKKTGQTCGVTLYMTLLAAFQVFLHHYTREDDIIVGTPASGRSRIEFRDIVGYFVNMLVMRTDCSGNPSFTELLKQVRDTVIAALDHQDYPFLLLVQRLHLRRETSYSPLYQVDFILQKLPFSTEYAPLLYGGDVRKPLVWGGLHVEPFRIPQQAAQCDLTLEMIEDRDSLLAVFKYNTDLFDPSTIARMAKHFMTLLEGITTNPRQKIGEYSLLTKEEQFHILVDWNSRSSPHCFPNEPQNKKLLDTPLHLIFENQVRRTPDATALLFGDSRMVYRELNEQANQIAHRLLAMNAKSGKPIGICLDRSITMIAALLGILKAGAGYCPLEPDLPHERHSDMIRESQMSLILTEKKYRTKFSTDHVTCLCIDSEWQTIAEQNIDNPEIDFRSKTSPQHLLLYILYTSGSTGHPVGVLGRHRGTLNRLQWMWRSFPFRADDICCFKTPVGFVGSVWEIFGGLLQGTPTVILPDSILLDPSQFIDALARYRVTRIKMTPSLLRLLLDTISDLHTQLPDLKQWEISGDILTPDLVQQFHKMMPERRLLNLYGSTEDSADVTGCCLQKNDEISDIPIGRPIDNTCVYILNKYLQPVPPGVTGEICISGHSLAAGYLNRPELTALKFVPNPFHGMNPDESSGTRLYKTGDLARHLPDGTIDFVGRLDRQIKLRGFRIEPGEIEAVLLEHPAIHECIVSLRENPLSDRRLVAYLVLNKKNQKYHNSSFLVDLRNAVKQKLPEYMIPADFVILANLPLNRHGKVDVHKLPAPTRLLHDEAIAPRDMVELKLLHIWSQYLNRSALGVRDNFYECGGYSLLAVQVAAEIQKQFQQNIPLTVLIEHPTIEQLAIFLRKKYSPVHWSPLVPIQPNGSRRPIYCVHPAGGTVFQYIDLAYCLGETQPFYGFQAPGTENEQNPLSRVEDMAAYYNKVLLNFQPESPYILAGWSFGGHVAFEMARQLDAMGHRISLLALLDTPAPPLQVEQDMPVDVDALTEKQLAYAMAHIKKDDRLAPPDFGIDETRRFLRVFYNNNAAAQHYAPSRYPGRLTLFIADEEDETLKNKYRDDPTLGWRSLATDVDVQTVPGSHLNLLTRPYVETLAVKLKMCIEKAYRE